MVNTLMLPAVFCERGQTLELQLEPTTYISRNICFNFEFEKDLYICPFETFWKQKAESKTQGCIKNHVSASRWDDSDPARTYFFCCGLDRCVWIRRAPHIRPELTKLV